MTATKVTSGLINFSTGKVLQNVYAESSAASTGTTAVVNDDTIPQKTEGNEVITLAITPVSATSRLIITGVLNLYNTAATYRIWALFKDDGADAIWADVNYDAVGVPKDHLSILAKLVGQRLQEPTKFVLVL